MHEIQPQLDSFLSVSPHCTVRRSNPCLTNLNCVSIFAESEVLDDNVRLGVAGLKGDGGGGERGFSHEQCEKPPGQS